MAQHQISVEEFEKKYPLSTITFDPEKWTSKRDRIIQEICTTESTYVRSLQVSISLYQVPLLELVKSGTLQIPEKKILIIFSNIADILRCHQTLHGDIIKRIDDWGESQKIGDVILTICPFLRMYKQYCEGYDEAICAIKEVESIERRFSDVLEKLVKHPLVKALGLDSYLILPVQRIPRYVLLLTDLLKNTEPNHPDYENISKALDSVKELASTINGAVAAAENREKLLSIQRLFSSTTNLTLSNNSNAKLRVVEPHRKYVTDGWLVKQCRKERKPRRFFLFSDILVYGFEAASGSGYYVLSGKMDLDKVTVMDVPDKPESNILNAILIQGVGKSFFVFANSKDEKFTWLCTVQDTISSHLDRTKTIKPSKEIDENVGLAPVWVPDDDVIRCLLCTQEFGLLYRKHHCRKCGEVICYNCSKRKLLVPAVDKINKQRVCDKCFAATEITN